ncbi:hypothetical protein C9374_002926 [Naegleria lovaniensis]|uniref:Uncharacterized protein n=1 Tax=Naegleria lovaniensis TaxID=51637 RepID=A0AA88GN79_NAELO|nr:uncharacterized protein C9374_002926 [Naegleria lovaniensis]KAG2385777.1 hypothetical protein C9374_002926 [Naegleria lovaniensis]
MSIIESVFHSLHSSPRFWFAIQSLVGIGAFSLFAHVMLKNRRFTLFYALFTSIHCLFTNSYFAANQFPILPIVGHFYLNASVFVHLFVLMKWRKLKPSWYLWSICLPGYFYLAWGAMGSMLSIPHSLLRIAFRPLFSHLDPNMTYFHLLTLSLTLYSFYLSFVSPTFGKEQVHIDLTHNRKKSEEELVDQSQNHDTLMTMSWN